MKVFFLVLKVELLSEDCKADISRSNASAFCVLTIICRFNLKMNICCFISFLVVWALFYDVEKYDFSFFCKVACSGHGHIHSL